jgi:hypothetical protein
MAAREADRFPAAAEVALKSLSPSSPAPATFLAPPQTAASQKTSIKLGCGCGPTSGGRNHQPVSWAGGRDSGTGPSKSDTETCRWRTALAPLPGFSGHALAFG